jgi:hypothetical protein
MNAEDRRKIGDRKSEKEAGTELGQIARQIKRMETEPKTCSKTDDRES